MIVFMLYIFVVGLVLGSFYNVVGLRIPAGQSIVRPRSSCTTCARTLEAKELIPVISYLWQRGMCRGCRTRISPLYPALELIHGLLFVLAFFLLGWRGETLVAWTLLALLASIVAADLRYMLIPNKILLFFLPLFIIERYLVPLQPWWDSILGAVVGFFLLFLIAMVSKGGMGGGDVKLFGLLGMVLGTKGVLLTLMLSSFLGTIFGLIGMALGLVKRGKPIPFGPFIAVGAIIAYFFGTAIINYYFLFF